MQESKSNFNKVPPQITLKKTQKSSNTDANSFSIIVLSQLYLNLSALRLQHVLRVGPKKQNRNLRYLGNGMGIIKKATALDKKDQQQPDCAVKIMIKKQAAENEVKSNILLGRKSVWGTMNNKYYVLIPWIEGITLRKYCKQLKAYFNKKTPMTLPLYNIIQRLQMFTGYLQQVLILHNHGLIIGDPKASNCMLDSKGNLVLIDLDAVHAPGDTGWARTYRYLPPNLIDKEEISTDYVQRDDVFIFGHMLAELFPEFFNVKFDVHCRRAATLNFVNTKPNTNTEKTLTQLISFMMHPSVFVRPLVEDCIKRLQLIVTFSQRDFPVPVIEEKTSTKISSLPVTECHNLSAYDCKLFSKLPKTTPTADITPTILGCITTMERITKLKIAKATQLAMLNKSLIDWLKLLPEYSDQIQKIYITCLYKFPGPPVIHTSNRL